MKWLLKERLSKSPSLEKISKNIAWLFFDKFVRLFTGVFVNILIARYLGPQDFGTLNYALALVSIFGVIAALGLPGIVVRDLVNHPETSNETLKAALILHILGAVFSILLIVLTSYWLKSNDYTVMIIIVVLSSTLFFQSTNIIKYWFESQVQSSYVVWVENSVLILMSIVKIILILNTRDLMILIYLIVLESILTSFGLILIFCKKSKLSFRNHFSRTRAKKLIADSWPLMISSMAIVLYMRSDQIMLGEMTNPETVGIYSVALQLSEIWYVIPMIVSASLFPSILEAKKESTLLYKKKIQQLLNSMVVISICISIVITISSKWLVLFLYGDAYKQAVPVLIINIWSGVFVFVGVIGHRWYLAENLQKLTLQRSLTGVVVNITLNYLLIPYYGALGAAIATMTAQIISSYAIDFFNKKTKEIFKMKTQAILFYFIFNPNLLSK